LTNAIGSAIGSGKGNSLLILEKVEELQEEERAVQLCEGHVSGVYHEEVIRPRNGMRFTLQDAIEDIGSFMASHGGGLAQDLRWDGGDSMLNPEQGRASLGLGTAATHDAQISLIDTTAGRLMEVGAFGLGGGPIILTGDEWDVTSMPNQFVRASNSSDSIFNRAGVGIHLRYSTTYAAQLFMTVTSTLSIKARATSASGVWGDVEELYHTGNLSNPIQGTGSAGRVAFWDSANGLTSNADFLFDNGTLRFANGTGGRGVEISNAGIRFKVTETGGWAMALTARDQSNNIIGNIVGGYGQVDSFLYAYLGGGTTYNNAALYAHSNNSVSINKTSVTSGYKLDVNGAIRAEGNIYATGNITGAGEVTAAGNITTEGRLHYKNLNGVVVTQGYSSSVTLSCNNGLHYYINHSAGNMTINISNIYPGSSGNIILYNSNSSTTRNVTLGTMSTYDGIVLNKYTSGTFTGLIGYHVITWFAINQGATANRVIMININKYS